MKIYWNEEYCAPKTDFETFQKSRRIVEQLTKEPSQQIQICDPADVGGSLATAQRQIEKYTNTEYLQAVTTGRPRNLAETNGFAWDEGVYRSVVNSTAGVLCAIDDLIDTDATTSASLSSGLHHANASRGLGFCTINSLAIGALYAREKGKKVAILDLDAHCGGGTTSMITGTDIAQFDLSTSNFDDYPTTEMNPCSVSAVTDSVDEQYIAEVDAMLDKLVAFGPDIVLYNAGVDISPRIDMFYCAMRDALVVKKLCDEKNIKTMVVCAGGYGDYDQVAWQHTLTLTAFVERGAPVA